MGDLLTHDEYKAIAAKLEFPTQAFIDGRFRPAMSPARGHQPALPRPRASERQCATHPLPVPQEMDSRRRSAIRSDHPRRRPMWV